MLQGRTRLRDLFGGVVALPRQQLGLLRLQRLTQALLVLLQAKQGLLARIALVAQALYLLLQPLPFGGQP